MTFISPCHCKECLKNFLLVIAKNVRSECVSTTRELRSCIFQTVELFLFSKANKWTAAVCFILLHCKVQIVIELDVNTTIQHICRKFTWQRASQLPTVRLPLATLESSPADSVQCVRACGCVCTYVCGRRNKLPSICPSEIFNEKVALKYNLWGKFWGIFWKRLWNYFLKQFGFVCQVPLPRLVQRV